MKKIWAFPRSPGTVFGLPCFQHPETLSFKPLKEQNHLYSSGVRDLHLFSQPKAFVEIFTSIVLLGTTFSDISPALHPASTLPPDISGAQASNDLFRLYFCSLCCSMGSSREAFPTNCIVHGWKIMAVKGFFPWTHLSYLNSMWKALFLNVFMGLLFYSFNPWSEKDCLSFKYSSRHKIALLVLRNTTLEIFGT